MLYQFHKSTSVDETNCFKSIMSFLGKSSMRCARKKTYRKIWGIARPLMQNRFLICKSFILSAACPSPIIPIRQIRKFCRKTLSLHNTPHSRVFYVFCRQSRLFCHCSALALLIKMLKWQMLKPEGDFLKIFLDFWNNSKYFKFFEFFEIMKNFEI